jgi:hypothetical protein
MCFISSYDGAKTNDQLIELSVKLLRNFLKNFGTEEMNILLNIYLMAEGLANF